MPYKEQLILNPEMIFDQVNEGAAYTSSVNEIYGLDQWRHSSAPHNTATYTVQRVTDAPPGFQNSMKFTTTVAKVSAVHDDHDHIEHPIEGYKIRGLHLGTSDMPYMGLQFWAKASIAGLYSVTLMDGFDTCTCVKGYYLSAPNQWTLIKIIYPPTTLGNWFNATQQTTGFGLKIMWDLGSGSDFVAPSVDAWNAGPYWKFPGSVSLTQNAGATLQITGAQLDILPDVTSSIPPFRYIGYAQQLTDIQRYFWKSFNQGTPCKNAQGVNGSLGYVTQSGGAGVPGNGFMLKNSPNMSAFLDNTLPLTSNGSYVFYNPVNNNNKFYNVSQSADSGIPILWYPGDSGVFVENPQIAGDAANSLILIHASIDARLGRF